MDQIALALVAGCGFALAGLTGLLGLRVGNNVRVAAISVGAGILLAVSFSDLVPEAFEMTSHRNAAFAIVAGFLLLYLLELVSGVHLHHHDPDDGHDHSRDDLAHHHALLPFLVGLALHNLVDGFAIGTSEELSHEAATAVTLGVLVHQLPVGVSFAAVLGAVAQSRAALIKWSIALALMIPAGAALLQVLGDMSESQVGITLGLAGGALIYVATAHLLPEAQAEERPRLSSAVFASTILAATALFTILLAHE